MDILEEIINVRRAGYTSLSRYERKVVPNERELPIVDFFDVPSPFIIAEYKRASPSAGKFKINGTKESIVSGYYRAGVRRFSVLTEQNYFGGNISDIIRLKEKFPRCAFLRKDFLFTQEDIHISYLAGADAVLLIAGILRAPTIASLVKEAKKLGIQTLCEVHSKRELDKILKIKDGPTAIGVNSRNLRDFTINYSIPLSIKPHIPSKIKTVFESGIKDGLTASIAGNAKFDAVLVGGSIVQAKNVKVKLAKIKKGLDDGYNAADNFFTKLYSLKRERFVKICGITNVSDAKAAVRCGADCLGVILAKSPRQMGLNFLERIRELKVLKVAVVKNPDAIMVKRLHKALAIGLIDGVQLHGNESYKVLASFMGNAYKVITVKDISSFAKARDYAPIVLFDTAKTFNSVVKKTISMDFSGYIRGKWVAGAINVGNIRKILKRMKPQLIDVCSGVERASGVKDRRVMAEFIREVKNG